MSLLEPTATDAPVRRLDPGEPLHFGVAGSDGTRLLAGPPRWAGAESLESHERRLGPLSFVGTTPASLRAEISASGLSGRGGGEFPTARKLDLAAASAGGAIVVVNASEGEPASRKDRTLLELRPHLVLDGAEVAAEAVEASEVVVYLHRSRADSVRALEAALAERLSTRPHRTPVRLVDAPAGYISGETSAVVSYLEGGGALPAKRTTPVAARGVAGRPTVVSNLETITHLGLIARFGARWWATSRPGSPGSTLVTLAGAVAVPGVVVELVNSVAMGRVLETVGGLDTTPKAVLVGGYEGTWVDGPHAFELPLERRALAAAGSSLGCGLLGVLPESACGVAETARLLRWLAGESSGQCGPCAFGLPSLSRLVDELANGSASRRDLRRIRELAASIRGRGACGHPTGAVHLVETALDAFRDEVHRHLRGASCDSLEQELFPLPGGGR